LLRPFSVRSRDSTVERNVRDSPVYASHIPIKFSYFRYKEVYIVYSTF